MADHCKKGYELSGSVKAEEIILNPDSRIVTKNIVFKFKKKAVYSAAQLSEFHCLKL